MTTSIYHYVYRITNIIISKHYYGARKSTNITPEEDLGVKYFSSSRDKEFILDQKEHPENFKYKVVRQFKDRVSTIEFEIFLHNKFDVGVNEDFYNRSKQTSTGFDYDQSGKTHTIETKLKISKGNIGKNKDIIPVVDSNGNFSSVHRNDPRYLSGKLVAKNKGRVSVKDSEGNTFQTSQDNPRIGITLFGVNKGVSLKSNHPRKRIYLFKDKKFKSAIDLSEYIGVKRRSVSTWCIYSDKIISYSSFIRSKYINDLGKSVIGKTYADIGFGIKEIN